MSKYTASDPDVAYLDRYDRVEFEFDMLEHNPDVIGSSSKNYKKDGKEDPDIITTAAYGWMAFKDPKNAIEQIRKQMKNWKTVSTGIITLLCFIFFIIFMISLIVLIVSVIKGVGWMKLLMVKVILSVCLLFCVVLVLFVLYNKVQGHTQSLVMLASGKRPNEPIDSTALQKMIDERDKQREQDKKTESKFDSFLKKAATLGNKIVEKNTGNALSIMNLASGSAKKALLGSNAEEEDIQNQKDAEWEPDDNVRGKNTVDLNQMTFVRKFVDSYRGQYDALVVLFKIPMAIAIFSRKLTRASQLVFDLNSEPPSVIHYVANLKFVKRSVTTFNANLERRHRMTGFDAFGGMLFAPNIYDRNLNKVGEMKFFTILKCKASFYGKEYTGSIKFGGKFVVEQDGREVGNIRQTIASSVLKGFIDVPNFIIGGINFSRDATPEEKELVILISLVNLRMRA